MFSIKLSLKHQLFVSNYLKFNTNAVHAYIATYRCSKQVAISHANQLVNQVEIQAEIKKQLQPIIDANNLASEAGKKWLIDCVMGESKNKENKASDRIRALEILMKCTGMLKEHFITEEVNSDEKIEDLDKEFKEMLNRQELQKADNLT